MATVGEIEKRTQARVVALFRDRLQYEYLGTWVDRDPGGHPNSPTHGHLKFPHPDRASMRR